MSVPNAARALGGTDQPNAARMYDYLLGGSHNFAADRAAADALLAVAPDARANARANRAFLRRVVGYLLDQGVRQFLDLGSGIPTAGNVHEIAHARDPGTRVVYVDVEPIAVETSRRLLDDNPCAEIVHADLRDPAAVRSGTTLLDPDEPVAVLAIAVLHFVPDGDAPADVLGAYLEPLVDGSYLALSHVVVDNAQPPASEGGLAVYARTTTPVTLRDSGQVAAFFHGHPLVEPGLVPVSRWRAETTAEPSAIHGAVARVTRFS
ncbi:SAM-dependent methyltransferase [Cryptosporangium aurantiacum]|uniref:S-adenosyl methyltransferase n=1 Tax=Cryptosporangium aurantiacum TaxID=134849 RepID=A0A1M7R985_9ACTN|nr:SAM-dependent methyltransferase [Cryptosporangium aurantiacum]SHN42720.1 S-adenosyl methyltransferase [Cryptosporangium aurantiacum]